MMVCYNFRFLTFNSPVSTYQTQGLVLSHRDFREADKFFSVYTDTHGKIEVLAAGVRKIKSKLRAHLEPFSVVDLMIAHGRRYDRLAGAISQKSYNKIKENYNLLIINYQLLEITDQLTKPHQPDPRIFNLLQEVFNFSELPCFSAECIANGMINDKCQMNKYSFFQPYYQSPAHFYFIFNLLSYLGYTPELKICVRCKTTVANKYFFSHHDGSVICEKCRTIGDQPVSSQTIEILQKYLTEDLHGCAAISNDEGYKLIRNFLNYHLDQPLRSDFVR